MPWFRTSNPARAHGPLPTPWESGELGRKGTFEIDWPCCHFRFKPRRTACVWDLNGTSPNSPNMHVISLWPNCFHCRHLDRSLESYFSGKWDSFVNPSTGAFPVEGSNIHIHILFPFSHLVHEDCVKISTYFSLENSEKVKRIRQTIKNMERSGKIWIYLQRKNFLNETINWPILPANRKSSASVYV